MQRIDLLASRPDGRTVLLHATAQSSRWLAPAQADRDNAPERVSGLAVAAIQAMASLSTGEGIKRRDATAGGEGSGSVRAQPAGIATGGHSEGTDHVRTDAELSEERRRGRDTDGLVELPSRSATS